MIYTDSRYATGVVARSFDSRNNRFGVTIFREFPASSAEYFYYTWTEKDRIDEISTQFLGDPSLWWVIMDYNPEQLNPLNIPIGTLLRIPNE
jgi:hypothetical protein